MAQLASHAFNASSRTTPQSKPIGGTYAPRKPQLGFQKPVAGLHLDQRHGLDCFVLGVTHPLTQRELSIIPA